MAKNERKFIANIFIEQMEQEAIDRIQRFAKIAKTMQLDIAVGFSGGKDSQVVYDLCLRSGIKFTAYFNHAFESPATLRFIREHYPNVVWRRDYKMGFIQNIRHQAILPTVQKAFCCDNYKHNPKYVDKCSIVGVRKEESQSRSQRTAISLKNKTLMKQNKELVSEYFRENCQSIGTKSIIQLLPIIDWTEQDVWSYIHRHHLPVNPEYEYASRVGCIVCPKANFTRNFQSLCRYPRLVDAFILALERSTTTHPRDWVITSDGKDYADDKVYYICRWLNHSFMPFTKRQQRLYEEFREIYDKLKHTENERRIENKT